MNDPFGVLITHGQLFFAIPVAVLAGFVSFASPCVLPLVPGYVGYIGGATDSRTHPNRRASRRFLLAGVGLFVLGFSLIFVAYGAAFGALGSWLVQWDDLVIRMLGIIVILMGLVFITKPRFLQRTLAPSWKPAAGLAGAPLLGIVFGLGWMPCVGPTLVAIQALSLSSGSPWRGALLGLFYCIGLGLPFILIALGFTWATRTVTFLRTHIRAINIAGGVLLVGIGALMVTGLWISWINTLQGMVINFAPAI